ncbi:hypothetical protein VUN84_08825 [Micrococcaceae bacterium Sec5.8]
MGEHRRHGPCLPQPGAQSALEHRVRSRRVVHQPHRAVVHARERHPMTGGEPGEPLRRGEHHLVPSSEQSACQRHERLDITARPQRHDQYLQR